MGMRSRPGPVVKPQLPPQLSAVSFARKNHWATGKVVRGADPRARKPAVPSILFGRGDPKLSMPQSCGTPRCGVSRCTPIATRVATRRRGADHAHRQDHDWPNGSAFARTLPGLENVDGRVKHGHDTEISPDAAHLLS
jgi:hypothetical protein